MRIGAPHSRLTFETLALPRLGPQQVLLEVAACGVCRTDLHVLDGGYAEHAIADARYCFRIPDRYDDAHAAPKP